MEDLSERQQKAIKEFFEHFSIEDVKSIIDDLIFQWMISEMADAGNRGERLFLSSQILELLKQLEPLDDKKARLQKELSEIN